MKLNLCFKRREHCLYSSRSEQWKGREAAFPASCKNSSCVTRCQTQYFNVKFRALLKSDPLCTSGQVPLLGKAQGEVGRPGLTKQQHQQKEAHSRWTPTLPHSHTGSVIWDIYPIAKSQRQETQGCLLPKESNWILLKNPVTVTKAQKRSYTSDFLVLYLLLSQLLSS